MRIGLVGVPCSGKTTTLKRLKNLYKYTIIEEYARFYIENFSKIDNIEKQFLRFMI